MRTHLSATGPADPDAVWDAYRRPARWPEWAPQITGVHCTDEVIRVGTSGRVTGPLWVSVGFEVTAVDEVARTWSWQVSAPCGIRLTLDHGVDWAGHAGEPTGTRTGLTIDGPAVIVLGYRPVAGRALRRLVR
ncbi:SRPBCC family protein [Nakamurella silvestris]|nr:SRPBCC family protein [Nakamurella silvestris]